MEPKKQIELLDRHLDWKNFRHYLEQAGLVITKTGSGTFVADTKERSADAADINILVERMDSLITRAINLGLKQNDLAEMFKSRLEKFSDESRNSGEENE